ncbi:MULTISPECIES: putative 2-aminoethylphosphonate ABC transporter substrate-binding protein [Virgibacillus]|uniref:Putative binding protein component of ABC iron transporter n=1 Tax=Virgibacillus massiliensis TaxID=1462526 RepID=A0A024QE73_9BACI|nr:MULTISPECIES: putative 2-aminoethylphosphonate ABC transporter substrate-binding protein [Virgibacillus]EQB35336.1 hypothetical protein M948_19745 [Virgibacillus sp. CM-4]MYL42638.1 putative 2-aminoethylphosphonate ABC transporter substrate-binding protein [Virgibacillus massiliensis]CDQ40522.1 putative binding protein component of ABC iron transporter precursor [Virgibacillus massiliensis]
MKKVIVPILLMLISIGILTACGKETSSNANEGLKGELTVYTAVEEELLPNYLESFEKKYPNVELNIVRDSTGIITAKLLSEGKHTKADVVWGVQASNLLKLDQQNLLQSYSPEGIEEVPGIFKDKNQESPKWVGNVVTASGITVNTVELEKMGLDVPRTYEDLTDPKYKGLIAMAHPASSGTGYLQVSTWLQMMGEEQGWKYMEDLHENVGMYTHSGSKPIQMAATGEFPISLGLVYSGVQEKQKGAPVEVHLPKEGLGWDVEANAMINKEDTESDKLAKAFLDWAISDEAMKEYHQAYGLATKHENLPTAEGFPENFEDLLYENHDLNVSAKNHTDIINTWESKFAEKAEPKK